jgi:DNA helicase HerA-like ATPase
LISAGGDPVPALPETFEDRHIYVIDVSRMASDAQDLVFASVIGKLREKMELGRLGVRRLIVAVDELNKYAPSGGRDTYVVQSLRDIAARGRYLGLTLFGAQQFRSKVDAQIVGNAANSAYGHIQLEELTNSIYTVYPVAIREKLATAGPGEMMVRHPHFSQPIFIKFPIPPVLKGSDGMARWPAKVVERIEDRIVRLAVANDPEMKPREVWAHLDQVTTSDRPKILHTVEQQLANGDPPRDVLRRLGKAAPQQVTPQYPADTDDPFA